MFACIHVPGLASDRRTLLLECASRFSPHLETQSEDLVVFDIRGLTSMYGEPIQTAQVIANDAAETFGDQARVAVAANPQAAGTAARGRRGITFIPPGDEARMLGSLPLHLLLPDDQMAEILDNWGIRTLGELAALPGNGITERLGQAGESLRQMARGQSYRPLRPHPAKEQFAAEMELDHPVDLLEPLSFIFSRLLAEICSRLATYGMAANELDAELRLDDGQCFLRQLKTPFASREPGTFLKLLQYDMAAHPPPAAVCMVRLEAHPVPPRAIQTGLFIPLAPEPEKLELTIKRMAALVGENNIGTPEIENTHRPGAYRMVRFAAKEGGAEPRLPEESAAYLAIRLFRPPLRANVIALEGRPQRVIARGVNGNVAAYAGPWRTSGDWWRASPWARDEWDVALDTGKLYRLVHEHDSDWFVEGNYD